MTGIGEAGALAGPNVWAVPVDPTIPLAATVAGTWLAEPSTGSFKSQRIYNNGPALNDGCVFSDVGLGAGTWELVVFADKDANRCIATFDLSADGGSTWVSLASLGGSADTVDLYNATPVAARATITGIVIPAASKYRLRVRALSKNASSTDYYCVLNWLVFQRTA